MTVWDAIDAFSAPAIVLIAGTVASILYRPDRVLLDRWEWWRSRRRRRQAVRIVSRAAGKPVAPVPAGETDR
mgnify:CR=1 FL=1